MTTTQIIGLLDTYEAKLRERGAIAQKFPHQERSPHLIPAQNHLMSMISAMRSMAEDPNKREKLMR